MRPRFANPPRECDVCEKLQTHAATMNGFTVCAECSAKLLYCADPIHRLTRKGEVRAADPRALFRGGGRSIADVANEIALPPDIDAENAMSFKLDALFSGVAHASNVTPRRHHRSSREARSFARDDDGFLWPGVQPQKGFAV